MADKTFIVNNYEKYTEQLENWHGGCPRLELREKNSTGSYRVAYDPANNCYVCVSYQTIVSYCPVGCKEATRLGKWSVTTSKHQSMFDSWCYCL